MKCVRNIKKGTVIRVKDCIAKLLVENNTAVYVPKLVWKTETRDAE